MSNSKHNKNIFKYNYKMHFDFNNNKDTTEISTENFAGMLLVKKLLNENRHLYI